MGDLEDFLEERRKFARKQIPWEEDPEAQDPGCPACSEPAWVVPLPLALPPARLSPSSSPEPYDPFPTSPAPGVTSAPGRQEAHLLLGCSHPHPQHQVGNTGDGSVNAALQAGREAGPPGLTISHLGLLPVPVICLHGHKASVKTLAWWCSSSLEPGRRLDSGGRTPHHEGPLVRTSMPGSERGMAGLSSSRG